MNQLLFFVLAIGVARFVQSNAAECDHNGCVACTGECSWCAVGGAVGVGEVGVGEVGVGEVGVGEVGVCVKAATCDDNNSAPLKSMLAFAKISDSTQEIAKMIRCPATTVSAVKDAAKATCANCLSSQKRVWCQFDQTPYGVCLDKGKGGDPCSRVPKYGATATIKVESTNQCFSCSSLAKCSGADGCKATAGCSWCYAKKGTKDTKLGYCTADDAAACDSSQFGTLNTLADFEVGAVETGGEACPIPNDQSNSFVTTKTTCDACVGASKMWCQLTSNNVKAGVCLDTSKTASATCESLKTSLGGNKQEISLASECPGFCSRLTKCSGADGCKATAGCSWCYAKKGTKDTKLGYCTADDAAACDSSQFGTLSNLGRDFKAERTLDTVGCPAADDKDNAFVVAKTTCDACADDSKHWCQLTNSAGVGAGVCLDSKKIDSATCDSLKTTLGTTGVEVETPDHCRCGAKVSCHSCQNFGCAWCGVTVKDLRNNAYPKGLGTPLGVCIDPNGKNAAKDYCPTRIFASVKPVVQYKLNGHNYKMEVVRFSATGKGWTAGDCKAVGDVNDITQRAALDANSAYAGCYACDVAKAKWCKLVLKNQPKGKKRTGGFCLGVDSGKKTESFQAICESFGKKGSRDYEMIEATMRDSCSGCSSIMSAGASVLIVAVIASLLPTLPLV